MNHYQTLSWFKEFIIIYVRTKTERRLDRLLLLDIVKILPYSNVKYSIFSFETLWEVVWVFSVLHRLSKKCVNNVHCWKLPPPATGDPAPTPEPTLVMSSFGLIPSRAFANNPGQYGSTSTPAAFRIVWIFSPCKNSNSYVGFPGNINLNSWYIFSLMIIYFVTCHFTNF